MASRMETISPRRKLPESPSCLWRGGLSFLVVGILSSASYGFKERCPCRKEHASLYFGNSFFSASRGSTNVQLNLRPPPS